MRNRTNNEIKTAKANYNKSKISQNTGDPKEIWRTINELTYRKCTNNSPISELKSGDISPFSTKPDEICEILNEHFTSVGPNLASTMATGSTSFDSYQTCTDDVYLTTYHRHSGSKVARQIISEQGHWSREHFLSTSKRSRPAYCRFFSLHNVNKTIDTGLFPLQWKMAKVFPLYKKNDRTETQNYRPISVLPAISKICERVVYDQLYHYVIVNSNSLLSKNLSGFRSLHSTVTALLHLTNDWYLNIDKGENNLIVLLDLAKAFDTVSHEILLKMLKLYGLEGVTLDWFLSHLSNRQQLSVQLRAVNLNLDL